MNQHTLPESDHRNIGELIPWYLNGTLSDLDRRRVELHMAGCAACRADLELERRIYERIARHDSVEHIAAPSLRRLQERIDGTAAPAPRTPQATAPPSHARTRPAFRRVFPWQGLMAASVAILAVALAVSTTRRPQPLVAGTPAADYHTVTTPTERPPGEAIRAVFAPTITLDELQSILALSHLKIVAGPTEAGVYSLAPTSALPVTSSLTILRRQHSVRFAEKTSSTLDGSTP